MAEAAAAPPSRRSLRLVDGVGLWCALGYASLAVLAREPGEPELGWFFFLAVWTGLPVFALFFRFFLTGEPFPVRRLLFWAVVFRLVGLAGGPFYEDDFYRYLWDGFRFATAGTPYGAAPEEFFVDPAVPALFQGVLDGVNYPELPTIYAPVTQLVFLLAYWIKPASVAVLQAILIAVDVAVIALLLRLAPARGVLLYAWCPLVVKEVAFTAHPDGIGVCLLLSAIVLAGRPAGASWRRGAHRWTFRRDAPPASFGAASGGSRADAEDRSRTAEPRPRLGLAAALLGLAVATKVFALVLAPLILVRGRFRHWLIFAATLLLVYLPFLVAGADLISLLTFARDWEFNSAVYGLLGTFAPPSVARLVAGLLFAAFWGVHFLRSCRGGEVGTPRGDVLFGVLLLLSPVINPWYLLWLLPFAAVYPSFWAWTASAAVLLSYVTGLHLSDDTLQAFAQPGWIRGLEFGLIGLAVAVDVAVRRRRGTGAQRRPA